MNIKEMEYIEDRKIERYVETEFCFCIRDIILKGVNNYNQEDIDIKKLEILSKIKEFKCSTYYIDEIKTNKYKVTVPNKVDLCSNESFLDVLIKDIKDRYIYEEALMQLVNENKLIPTVYQTQFSMYKNGADISVEINHNSGSEYLYLYLDLLSMIKFRVSAII